jgi:hypothetical protein
MGSEMWREGPRAVIIVWMLNRIKGPFYLLGSLLSEKEKRLILKPFSFFQARRIITQNSIFLHGFENGFCGDFFF